MRAMGMSFLVCVIAGCASMCGIVVRAEPSAAPDLGEAGAWSAYKWNRAPGEISASTEIPDALKGAAKGSLSMKIKWPGGEQMGFFSVVPSKETPVAPGSKFSLWIKGGPGARYSELHFLCNGKENADSGKPFKIGIGQLGSATWRKAEGALPSDWPQPITLKSITFHNWNQPDPGEDEIFVAGLEFHD